MSNTITIHGKQVQEDMIQMADACVKGAGDGRISLADAEKLFALVRDGSKYTDSEKDTMLYIRDNYKWTDEADAWFRTKVREWAASN
jgi:hypothetical protein